MQQCTGSDPGFETRRAKKETQGIPRIFAPPSPVHLGGSIRSRVQCDAPKPSVRTAPEVQIVRRVRHIDMAAVTSFTASERPSPNTSARSRAR